MKPSIASKYGKAIIDGLGNGDFTATRGKILILLQSLHGQGEYDIWHIETENNTKISLLGLCVRMKRYDVIEGIASIWGNDKIKTHVEGDGRNLLSHLYGQAIFTRESFSQSVLEHMNDYKKVIVVLKKAGVAVDGLDHKGQNLIHCAALTTQDELMKEALRGVNKTVVNQPDNDGNTPLHLAVQALSLSGAMQAKTLLSKGANMFIENKKHASPYAMILMTNDNQGRELRKIATDIYLRTIATHTKSRHTRKV